MAIHPLVAVAVSDGRVTVTVNDTGLLDFIDDYLTEECDGMQVDWLSGSTLYLEASARLEDVDRALSLLPAEQIERIWLLNNHAS